MFLNKKAVRFVYTVVMFQNDLASKLWLCLTVVQCLFGDYVFRQMLARVNTTNACVRQRCYSFPSPPPSLKHWTQVHFNRTNTVLQEKMYGGWK